MKMDECKTNDLLVLETELSREKERLRWKRHIAYTKSDFEGRRELNKRIRHLGSSIRDLSVKVEEEKEKSTRRNTFPRSRTRSFPAKPRSAASAIGLAKGLTRRSSEGNPKPIRRECSEDRILTRSLSDPGSPSIELLEDLNTSDLIDHLSECGSSTSSGSDGVADNAIKVEVRVSKS
eukprot:480727_1